MSRMDHLLWEPYLHASRRVLSYAMRPLLGLFAVLAVFAAACGGDEDPADTTAPPSQTFSGTPSPTLTLMESPCPYPDLDIYRIDVAKAETSTVAQGQRARWSHDGSLMSYWGIVGSNCAAGIAVDRMDTLKRAFILPGASPYSEWSPTSNTLLTGGMGNVDVDLELIFFDDASVPIIRSVFHGQVGAVSWSRDGSRFAYVNGETNEIVVYDIPSRDSIVFPSPLGGIPGGIGEIAWSPMGERLAVWAYEHRDDGPNVSHLNFLSIADGTTTEITGLAGAAFPEWSPDGSMLIFAVTKDPVGEIYILPTDGSAPARKLVDGDGGAWSPDGSLIAYTPNACNGWDIAVIAPDGTGQRILSPGAGHRFQLGFEWAPDGSRAAFLTDDATYTVSTDGTSLTRIGSQMEKLAWSPDSRYLVGQEIAGRGLCDG
ncbi:MAG TPA: hypothetical protein VFP63_08360 [Dehalococcoidia bacterium]|nr:hypothetical protein [Dehalococcoidia bacterium]